MAMPGAGSYSAGFSPEDQQYHQSNIGQPYVYSGYWGKPVYASELPEYEKAAYGFPLNSPAGGGGGGGQWVYDGQTKTWHGPNGQSIYDPTGKNNPGGGGGVGGGIMPGGGGGGFYSGASSYSAQGGMGDPWGYANAAANVLENMYSKMKVNTARDVNTDAARRGIFSSGVTSGKMTEAMNALDLQKAADIARLYQTRNDQLYSMSGSGGGGGSGNIGPGGAFGPYNMGGFGSALPGFSPMPGSPAVNVDDTGKKLPNPGTGFSIGPGWGASTGGTSSPNTTAGFGGFKYKPSPSPYLFTSNPYDR